MSGVTSGPLDFASTAIVALLAAGTAPPLPPVLTARVRRYMA